MSKLKNKIVEDRVEDEYDKVYNMDRSTVLKSLQNTDVYRGMTQKVIINKVGNSIYDLRTELIRLQRRLKTFEHFEKLPVDIQSIILQENNKTLKLSQRLNKTLRQPDTLASQTYYERFCHLPMMMDELFNYRNEHPSYFVNYYDKTIYVYNSYNCYNNNMYQEQVYNIKENRLTKHGYIDSIIHFHTYPRYIDIVSTYNIYKRRHCENIKPGYAKSRVITIYNQRYKEVDFNSYSSMISWFMYLRSNLKAFDVDPVPKNIYQLIIVDPTKDEFYGKQQYTYEQLMVKLSTDCEMMHRDLMREIDNI